MSKANLTERLNLEYTQPCTCTQTRACAACWAGMTRAQRKAWADRRARPGS